MEIDAALVSHALGAAAFGGLTLLLAFGWRGTAPGAAFLAAAGLTALWAGLHVLYAAAGVPPLRALLAAEVARDLAWIGFLALTMLAGRRRVLALAGAGALAGGVLALDLLPLHRVGGHWAVAGHLALALAGLVAVEQLWRNAPPARRWALKFLCLGLGGLFAYDFYLYADALLLRRISPALWQARVAAEGLMAPLLAVAAARNRDWAVDIAVSRRAVFHSAALLGAGVYLLFMAAAGYYIRRFGGTWGAVWQVVFLVGAAVLLAALMASGRMRAWLRVFISRNFYSYKHDYRDAWMRLTRTLAGTESDLPPAERAIHALAELFECPGGALWLRDEHGAYRPRAWLNLTPPPEAVVAPDEPLAAALAGREWVIEPAEVAASPERYPGLRLPPWLEALGAWLVVPLWLHEAPMGFVVLAPPRAPVRLIWEDYDLLRIAGRQAAGHLAQMQAAEALSQARQFEAYHRLSAYVVHDLKNLAAQLGLLAANARRHGGNPAFLDDMVATLENAVGRMNRLVAQLRSGRREGARRAVDLAALAAAVVTERARVQPAPRLEAAPPGPWVEADPDRLTTVLRHVVQNAQEATPPDGRVTVRVGTDGGRALVEIEDTGTGMDATFLRERLFRPFDSTKGLSGMGIGAYECREYVRALGGEVAVESSPGRGTCFRIRLPLAAEAVQEAAG
ncbi:XrtA/PEP-CTERM system histidine kinase PrsK [Inmirania thermothiophila]|uniref:histidine kinase n=1 Tax=Inmirania thermothiophila TaxID=1750597 RepID=A0A3N1Y7D0_9GAMM|nr:XrtA/PEP-CTERM system histidine kinase PrsK [Inmirania thermothiophila]ROR34713.1 putative PEP-CTERM system histidine kinase [Inmirania thermothiophila]